jgi:hypothetical protein
LDETLEGDLSEGYLVLALASLFILLSVLALSASLRSMEAKNEKASKVGRATLLA